MRSKKINLKGILCALMSGAMILTLVTPATAATARATTMKLEKIQGTVTLKTQNGSTRKITKGMRLYNGNTLATAKYSYAHISLDSTKAVKLDQSSSATLRQSGKQLELLVKSGKLFFNVSKKLDAKESMNVRTSTMVTGIRGTCGVVESVSSKASKLYLIEGKVTLGTGKNVTVIKGGQVATVILKDKPSSTDPGKPGETDKEDKQQVSVEKLTEENIPPVALQEIVADPVLQEKIEQTTELKIEKIKEALEQFEKEEAERIEQEKAEQEKEEEKDKDKEQEDKKEDENTTSSGGGSYTPDTPAPTSATLSGTVSAAAINAALTSYSKVIVATVGKDADGNQVETSVTLEESVAVPAGKVLIMETGEVKNAGNLSCGEGTLINRGSVSGITDSALLSIDGDATVYAKEFYPRVADYLNEYAQKSLAVSVDFKKNAIVKSNITLQPASGSQQTIQWTMNGNTLEIQSGVLTLASDISVTGTTSGALVLLSGGNLVLQGTSKNSNVILQNLGQGATIRRTAGTVTWNDTNLAIANKNGAQLAIDGASESDDMVKIPDWVKIKTGYVAVWQENEMTLKFVSSEFTSGTVTAAELNQALSVHTTVTVGPNVTAELTSGDTVTVPAGKTLRIQSQMTASGDSSDQLYSNGFDLNQGTITLKDKASLNVSGYVWGTGTINAGETSGAEVLVTGGGTLNASQIKLTKGSSIINSGTIDAGTITTDGTETIQNNALIKTQKYEHLADTSGTGAYSGVPGSVLVNNLDLSKLLSGVNLLAYANVSETATAGLQYFYSDSSGTLGTRMAERINTIKTHSGVDELKNANAVWWHFERDALVPSDAKITLTDFKADMGTNELQVAGTLTLSGSAIVEGQGEATVRLKGGILNLAESGAEDTNAEIKNTSTAGYAIARDSGTLNWNNKSFHIGATGGFSRSLAGLTGDGTAYPVTVPSYVKLVDGKIQWNSYQKQLRYVPSAFLNPEETVGKEQIDWSLGANSTMTIGKEVPGLVTTGAIVVIPAGKTLRIQSTNFYMATGSAITLEAGATLIVEGNITGSGTITVGTDSGGATLEVSIGGSVTVDQLTTSTGSKVSHNENITVAGKSYVEIES